MKRLLLTTVVVIAMLSVSAQRCTETLDRGLVAVKTASGVYCSWRMMGEEYYDVKYNLYRDGTKVNSEPLDVSNYTDAAGSTGSKYTVKAVVRGTEQAASKEATVWSQSYMEITPDHGSLVSEYQPNDACMADVDGDGELEILIKMWNQSDVSTGLTRGGYQGEYSLIEVYKLNGKKLWWVECGPNMTDFQNNETNIVAYDWDGDGKAEAVMRAADGTVIHMADGTTQVIGDATKNYRPSAWSGQTEKFVHDGDEFLVYMNGETGKPYQVMEYPLKRLESGETNLEKAWGDGYGHRSTKHFFGAPYLDGRKPSLFLARGIYTRHKMIALDVNPATHELTERWRWNCNTSSSPWYGNGYHNYAVADVDWDGRDEICFGSMVIDDNGKGLSTTGLGHGDAQHHSDFNPYIHGHEIFACNEDLPDNNYRDATTSKIYYRQTSTNDDGRAMAGNFCNDYPGAMAYSGHDTPISCVYNTHIDGLTSTGVTLNMRIYWDGDLQEESFNGTALRNSAGAIFKYGQSSAIETLTGSLTNNDTKSTPCYQGDILGDWREEVMMRTADNKIRIYTTTMPTEWRNYTLWHDMQYRQAMVWQMCGYNQPPHTSYFLGELEGITQAPPALTMTGRTEIANGGNIATSDNAVIACETNDMTVSVSDGASPYIFFDNAPSWTQGHDDNDNITTQYYTHTLTGGAFAGSTRVVKQGDGILVLPNVTEKHTGNTDVWAGTLRFDGVMESSPVWLNRHSNLISEGGNFKGGIKAEYNATIYPGGKDKTGTLTTTTLNLGFGSRVVFDVNVDGTADVLSVSRLAIEKKDWQYGPAYITPVFQIVIQGAEKLPEGKYLIAHINETEGSLENIKVEGIGAQKASLTLEEGKLYLNIAGMREATEVTWDGGTNGVWDFAETENFKSASGEKNIFVSGDVVTFDDQATNTNVVIAQTVSPSAVIFNNFEKNYTLSGESMAGEMKLTKNGTGKVTVGNVNTFTGNTYINAGVLEVSKLADAEGTEFGALGGVTNNFYIEGGGTLSITATTGVSHAMRIRGGTIQVTDKAVATMKKSIIGDNTVMKTGKGQLSLYSGNRIKRLEINEGSVYDEADAHSTGDSIIFNGTGGTMKFQNSIYSYSSNRSHISVPEGKTGTIYLDGRCTYSGSLVGSGTLSVYSQFTRSPLTGDWSQFSGTLKTYQTTTKDCVFSFCNAKGLPNATLDIQAGCEFKNYDEQAKKTYNNLSIGALAGGGTLGGSGTYYIGTNNKNASFSGTIGDGINIVKQGTGKWTLTQEQTTMGTLALENGQIELRKSTTNTMTGEKAMTAKTGATLSGFGCLGNSLVTFESGSTLNPGVSGNATTMTLTFLGDVVMDAGSKLKLDIYNWTISSTRTLKKCSQLDLKGSLTMNGEIEIAIPQDERYPLAFAAGDEFTLWTGTLSGNPTVKLGELPEGLKWDASKLLSEGKLSIVESSTGIKHVDADKVCDYQLSTIGGVVILQMTGSLTDVRNAAKVQNLPSGVYVLTSKEGSWKVVF